MMHGETDAKTEIGRCVAWRAGGNQANHEVDPLDKHQA
jgi:hypothetical protein